MARRPTRLLVATRHNPFPENDGAGAYLFDILEYLKTHGFVIEVVWLHADGAIKNRKHWRVPDRFAAVAKLHIIEGQTLGRTIWFWDEYWYGAKARTLNGIKVALKAIGLGFIFASREARRAAAASAAPAPSAGTGHLTVESWSALPSPAEVAFFQKHLRRFQPDAVMLNYCWLAPLADGLAPLPVSILANDVVSQRLRPTPGLAVDPATPEGESSLLRRARHIISISPDDIAVFRSMLPEHSIVYAPKSAEARPLSAAPVAHRVLFVGGINDFNREGIQWFLREVWPLIREKNPHAHLHICGGIGSTLQNVPEGVVIRGRVPDLTAEYAEASAVIVPLLQGSGVKIKLVEAASFGKPIVTTPIGLQGLAVLRDSLIEADTAQTFAEGVLRLLSSSDLQKKLSRDILRQVSAHLSRESAYGPVRQALTVSST